MPCNIENNWLEEIKQKLSCGLSRIPVEQLKSASIGFQIEALLCKCPTILDSEQEPSCNISSDLKLSQIYNRLKCGTLLTEAQIQWAQSNIFIKQKECCEATDAVDPVDTFEIFAAGIHDWDGGAATTDSIPVVGLLATDIIQTTLVARNATENLILSVNDFTNDQIDLTLSANGTDATTKISYVVIRPS